MNFNLTDILLICAIITLLIVLFKLIISEKSFKATKNNQSNKEIMDAISSLSDSQNDNLNSLYRNTDILLSSKIDSSFKSVADRLEKLYSSFGEVKAISSNMTNNIANLSRVLTNVKSRGTWAEVQLEGILNDTIPGMFEKNFQPNLKIGDRVEFAVKLPSANGNIVYLPIDSKFPLEDYIRLCQATESNNKEGISAAEKSLETRIIAEAKSVNKYINSPITTPFAILYLATEGLYTQIAVSDRGIADKLKSEYNVMIAGPSTITALLNSIALGFQAISINEKTDEITELLQVTRQQYELFSSSLSKAQKKIDEAQSAIDECQKRNEIIRKKLNNV